MRKKRQGWGFTWNPFDIVFYGVILAAAVITIAILITGGN